MPVVHLTSSPEPGSPAPARILPGRVDLTLGQLLLLAHRSGDLRLPLTLPDARSASEDASGVGAPEHLHERLSDAAGRSPGVEARTLIARETLRAAGEDSAAIRQLRDLHVVDDAGTPAGEVIAALRVLAAPEVLLQLDLAVGGLADGSERRLRSWVGVRGSQLAQLSTATGVSVELAWGAARSLSDTLARAVTIDPSDASASDDDTEPVPERFSIPFDLYTQGTEAARLNRPDVLAEMVRQSSGPVEVDGRTVSGPDVVGLLRSVSTRAAGRLRVLVSVPEDEAQGASRRRVGVLAWSRFGEDWWALDPVTRDHVPRIDARRTRPEDLGRALGPILAQVVG